MGSIKKEKEEEKGKAKKKKKEKEKVACPLVEDYPTHIHVKLCAFNSRGIRKTKYKYFVILTPFTDGREGILVISFLSFLPDSFFDHFF